MSQRPTDQSILGPIIDELGEDIDIGRFIHYYAGVDPEFSDVFRRYIHQYVSPTAEGVISPEQVAQTLREAHYRDRESRNGA